jgi:hypothetical protein
LLHALEHITRELDRAQHVSDGLGIEHTGDFAAREQAVPLFCVNTRKRC